MSLVLASFSRSAGEVLNSGTSPVFDFQKFSRWYRANWGVVRDLRLGLLGSILGFEVFGMWLPCVDEQVEGCQVLDISL